MDKTKEQRELLTYAVLGAQSEIERGIRFATEAIDRLDALGSRLSAGAGAPYSGRRAVRAINPPKAKVKERKERNWSPEQREAASKRMKDWRAAHTQGRSGELAEAS